MNIVTVKNNKINKNIVIIIVIMIISLSTFSCFYNHFRTGQAKNYWYMSEEEYMTSKWGKNCISDGQIAISQGLISQRIVTTSDGNPLSPRVNRSEIETKKISPNSTRYYFDGPYVLKPGTSLSGLISWLYELKNVDDSRAQNIIKNLGANYSIIDNYYHTNLDASIAHKRSRLYDSGRFNFYLL